ncbi:MAG: cache domain-containing protein [Candidatus Krumholzibacteria bacterium]|nr:cache domain-containing protein [Candidatus Krumholzibacteria bacterium]
MSEKNGATGPLRRLRKTISLRARLLIGLLLVVLLSGLTSTTVGIRFINDGIVKQAQNQVRLDLNTAREIYNGNIREIQTLLEFSAIRPSIWNSLAQGDTNLLRNTLTDIYEKRGLDILNITDDRLRIVFRCANPAISGDSQETNSIVGRAWERGGLVGSTQVLSHEELRKEGNHLAERARVRILPTPKARPLEHADSTSGMMIVAAVPLHDEVGQPLGVLYGGILLNRRYDIVDKIKNTVYRDEVYNGEAIGTSTIFQGDTRISTNVFTEAGDRAIGTRVSSEVHDEVLVKGRNWIDRAFVVNNWYITAYEPIRDVSEEIIGILYVGVLEKPYDELRRRIILSFLSITLLGIALVIVISYVLSRRISKPVGQLAKGAQRLARGELDHRIVPKSSDEIGQLCHAFNAMAESLLDRDRQLWERTQRQLSRSEKLASVGRLAAGVAHEINNPLTGVLTFSNLLLQDTDLSSRAREDVQVIVDETTRCREIVKNLLDFARETAPEIVPTSVNAIVEKTLDIVRKQSLFGNIVIEKRLRTDLPKTPVDPNQIQQVILNIILNAAEAMPDGGTLTLSSNYGADRHFIKISVQDTGTGIPKNDLDRIFDPFYTTKQQGKGTGLGLAVSYGIVEQHGGNIAVSSQVNKGSTFEINLPVAKDETNS